MKILMLLITVLAFWSCSFSEEDSNTKKDEKRKEDIVVATESSCEHWEYQHPTKEGVISANLKATYHLGQVLSVSLETSDALAQSIQGEELLKENAFIGGTVGFVTVHIPEDGDYIVWLTSKASLYVTLEDQPTEACLLLDNCKEQFDQGGYLRAVVFSLKQGSNTIKLSHASDTTVILTVARKPVITFDKEALVKQDLSCLY